MKEAEITSPEVLDAALVGSAMRKREKLWKAADGAYTWYDIFGHVGGVLLLIGAGYSISIQQNLQAIPFLAIGAFSLGSAAYRHQQSQIVALRELLRQNERAGAI